MVCVCVCEEVWNIILDEGEEKEGMKDKRDERTKWEEEGKREGERER